MSAVHAASPDSGWWRAAVTTWRSRWSSVLFGLVVTLCVAQVVWWTIFQVRDARTLQRVAVLLERGDAAGAAHALGGGGDVGELARRRWVMFASEGAALSLAVLTGVVLFYAAAQRERRMRQQQARFLTGATHELKTPLTTLRLGLESLLDGRVPAARTDQYLRTMVDQVERLENDVNNLLRTAGLRTAGGGLRAVPGDLAADVEQVVEGMRPRFDAAGIALAVELERGLAARRDPEATATLVRNLLDNACKFSERGGQVRVALRRRGGRAELRVADRGAGVPRAELGLVFEPLFRGSRMSHVGGAGLGLALVAQIARAHGGKVTAHSDGDGAGSEFVVELPLLASSVERAS